MATCSVVHILESQLATQIHQTTEELTFGKQHQSPRPDRRGDDAYEARSVSRGMFLCVCGITGWRRVIGCLIFMCHFLQKSL